jgi:hypothetical protein
MRTGTGGASGAVATLLPADGAEAAGALAADGLAGGGPGDAGVAGEAAGWPQASTISAAIASGGPRR